VAVSKQTGSWIGYTELAAIFFLQAMAMGMWLVPLGGVLNAHGLGGLRPYAYATSALAAFISPLIFGALADQLAHPARVLRWLALASGITVALASWSIGRGWPRLAVLGVIQLYSLAAAPTNSLASTIVFSRLEDSQRQFGPIRAMATFGWMCGCWLVSALTLDASPAFGYAGALIWLALAACTFAFPKLPPPPLSRLTFRQRMGWDALVLLKNHDHRVVFLTSSLFCIPLAAFYPFTPPHLQHLGFQHTSAWMSLAQVTEIIAMFSLAGLFARWRLKWIFVSGLTFGVVRFVLCGVNQKYWLLAGVTLHGVSFTLVFITAQIYLNERIEAGWRARAQALMALMNSGVGNLIGYLGTGFWFQACAQLEGTRWRLFWGGLASAVACVLVFFLIAYHGKSTGFRRPPSPSEMPQTDSVAS
jgi:MFS family permease